MLFTNLSPAKTNAIYSQCHKSFEFFVKVFWPIIVPNPLVQLPYLTGVCNHLQRWGTDYNQLCFEKCPRIGVSLISNIFFPAWYWATQNPSAMFLHGSFNYDLSTEFSIKCRKLIESDSYQHLFKHKFQLSADLNKIDHFANDRGGERRATSTYSQTIGSGCWFQILDDACDPKQIGNANYRQSVVDFYDEQFRTRINPGVPVWGRCIIGARLHAEDFIGQIINREGSDWHVVSLPLEANSKVHSCPIWTDKRKEGDSLHNFFDAKQLANLKKNSFVFSTQYNTTPIVKAGSKFSKVNYYSRNGDVFHCGDKTYHLKDMTIWMSSDCAVSEKSGADRSVIFKWGQTLDNGLILLDAFIGKLESPRLKKMFQQLYDTWKPQLAIVETDGIGLPLVQELQQTMSIKRFRSRDHGDKEIRSYRFQSRMEDERIWFPRSGQYASEIANEILAFPNGKDDVVDCCSQACIVLERYAHPQPIEEQPITPEQAQADHEDFLAKCMSYDRDDTALAIFPKSGKWDRAIEWSKKPTRVN